jgi:large subunit ribosomal protein L17
MKHSNSIRKFSRRKKQRRALLVSLARSLILKEKIKTTEAKAKSLRPLVEKLITKGKRGLLSDRKIIISRIGKNSVQKIVHDLGLRYKERKGGYTRISKILERKSDGSRMAVIELIK